MYKKTRLIKVEFLNYLILIVITTLIEYVFVVI